VTVPREEVNEVHQESRESKSLQFIRYQLRVNTAVDFVNPLCPCQATQIFLKFPKQQIPRYVETCEIRTLNVSLAPSTRWKEGNVNPLIH
jgi:hypothetical protein